MALTLPIKKMMILMAFCKYCNKKVLLQIENFYLKKESKPNIFLTISCSHCGKLLNLDDELKIEYHSLKETEEIIGGKLFLSHGGK